MNYVIKEPVLKTVASEDLTKLEDIQRVLNQIHRMQYFAEIGYVNDGVSMNYSNCRITSVSEDSISIHVFQPNANLKIANIPITALQKIKIIASKQEVAQKYKVSRWMLIDVAEISE